MVRGQPATLGATCIRDVGLGVYEMVNGGKVHAVAFIEERWHGGSIEHAEESASSAGPA